MEPKVSSVHSSLLLVPFLSQMNQVYTIPPYFSKLHCNIIFPSHTVFQSGLLPSVFPTKILHVFLISPMWGRCTAHLILLDLITQVMFGEAYKLWLSSLLFDLLQSTTFLQGPIFNSAPCFQTSSIHILPLMWETKFYTHTKQQVKWWFCVF